MIQNIKAVECIGINELNRFLGQLLKEELINIIKIGQDDMDNTYYLVIYLKWRQ